jgi:hypothetical protein
MAIPPIKTIPLSQSGVFSVHDNPPIKTIPLSQSGVFDSSVHNNPPINHTIPLSQSVASPGFDIDVSDPEHLLTGDQAKLLRTDMTAAANEWMDYINNPHYVPINILINITDDDNFRPSGSPAFYASTGTGANATGSRQLSTSSKMVAFRPRQWRLIPSCATARWRMSSSISTRNT